MANTVEAKKPPPRMRPNTGAAPTARSPSNPKTAKTCCRKAVEDFFAKCVAEAIRDELIDAMMPNRACKRKGMPFGRQPAQNPSKEQENAQTSGLPCFPRHKSAGTPSGTARKALAVPSLPRPNAPIAQYVPQGRLKLALNRKTPRWGRRFARQSRTLLGSIRPLNQFVPQNPAHRLHPHPFVPQNHPNWL
jgi:hypothetical protein